jgi:hypothetical protein
MKQGSLRMIRPWSIAKAVVTNGIGDEFTVKINIYSIGRIRSSSNFAAIRKALCAGMPDEKPFSVHWTTEEKV